MFSAREYVFVIVAMTPTVAGTATDEVLSILEDVYLSVTDLDTSDTTF